MNNNQNTISETSPHYKFAQYWEAIGRPDVEMMGIDGWISTIFDKPVWVDHLEYRIKGDRHWQLRKEWVDSGYELPIEYFSKTISKWVVINYSLPEPKQWCQKFEYRKLEPKQEQTMDDKLPTIVKGKKLELIDAPISTLPECLAALAAGYRLESANGGLHFLDGDMFAYVDNYGNKPTRTNDFYFQPFVNAYKLVDAPWWENIPDGGVLCFYDKGNDIRIVLRVNEQLTPSVYYGEGNSYTSGHVSDYKPVTDQWLDTMKRGF